MITVRVDGQTFAADVSQINQLGDLLELVKVTMNPDSIIVDLSLNDKPLSENDWSAPLSSHTEAIIDIQTGNKADYLHDRLGSAVPYLQEVIEGFDTAAAKYRASSIDDANEALRGAADDLLSFIRWYIAILAIEPVKLQPQILEFTEYVKEVQEVCEGMLDQQEYQTWLTLAETIETKLQTCFRRLLEFLVKGADAA